MDATLAQVLSAPDCDLAIEAVWSRASIVRWEELSRRFQQLTGSLAECSGQRVGLAFRADAAGIATLAALQHLQSDVFLFDAELPAARRQTWADLLQLTTILVPDGDLPLPPAQARSTVSEPRPAGRDAPSSGGSVTILTSGTTGQPKAVRHSWTTLARPVRRQTTAGPQRWLLAYRPHLYAGLQVILQSLLNYGTLVVADPQSSPSDVARLMAESQVEFVSATPSYLRRLLISADPATLARVPLAQLTLGGEVVDQPILDGLRTRFPRARIVHIYATTEMGRCFSVTDGKAGFPASFLERRSKEGVELKVVDGQLWVRSANAMAGYDPRLAATGSPPRDWTGWYPTGDLVRPVGDRYEFVGRDTDLINVGGNKVAPLEVERLIRELPEVADVRVMGHPSSLAGELVACQVVPRAGVEAESLRQRVRTHCQARLERAKVPRLIEIVAELPLNSAGKVSRRRSESDDDRAQE